MTHKWIKGKFRGVRYFYHCTRKYKRKPDRYFSIRFMVAGETKEEGLGWESEGWTEEEAYEKVLQGKKAAKTGEGDVRIADIKRRLRKQREDQKRKELKQLQSLKTIREWGSEFFDWLKDDVALKRYKDEKGMYDRFIEPKLGNVPAENLSENDLKKYITWLKKQKRKGRDTTIAPRTVEYVIYLLSRILDHAGVKDRPTAKAKKPKFDNKSERFLTREEASKLLDALRERKRGGQKLHDQALISLHCGLRLGEVLKLRVMHINQDVGKHGIINIMDPKNKKKNRSIPMTADVAEAVRRNSLRPIKHGRKILGNEDKKPQDFLFSRKGTVNEPQRDISKSYPRTVEALGFNEGVTDNRFRVTFHTLRHTYASWQMMSGKMNLFTLQKLMGHEDIKTTERYAKLAPDHFEGSADIMQGIWDGE